jgi:hypothetical protein
MMLSDRIESIIFAFDSRDSRREDIRALAGEVRKLEAAIESAKCLAEIVGEVDEDIHFVPMPQASLTESERTSIAADGKLHKCWHDFQDAIGETS